jgi:MinD-like ATPase involved in chromosome partitioning or flagellar assembly
MLVGLVSAKGSPGVTTAGLCLAAAAGQSSEGEGEALVVESDPTGGDLECWCGPHGEPGLVGLVTDLRREAAPDRLLSHAVDIVPGVRAVTAPTTEAAATAALVSAGDRLGPALATLDGLVVMDCGRWSLSHQTAGQVAACSLVAVVCRPALHSVEHARALVDGLRGVNTAVAVIVVGGSRPYGPDEIGSALRVPVAGVLPWDPEGVVALVDHGVGRVWSRSSLAEAAGQLVDGVRQAAEAVWARA